MSRLSSLVLVVAWLGVGCSSMEPGEMGAGGHAGAAAGTSGSIAGSGGTVVVAGGAGGGSTCSLPPSDSRFGCAATYDAQAARVLCTTAIETDRRASAGQCGAGWAWRCGTQLSFTCFYDSDKHLVRARRCEDAPTPLCADCNCAMPNCLDSADISTDGQPICDLNTLPAAG